MTSFTFDAAAALLIVAIGGWIIIVPDVTRAVIGFIVYGLMLTIVWVRLSAVDVALTEAAIGGGLTGMLLINAAGRLRAAKPAPSPGALVRLIAALLCIAVSASLAVVIFVLPSPAPTLAPLAVENLPQTGLGNPVAAVLFAYRALDTLLEKVVLLLALLSVWSLAADRVWPGMPGLHAPASAGSTLGFLARHLPPFGIIIGVYMCWIGATQPGGAFQGGTVVAAMWLLIMIAGMRAVPSIDGTRLRLALVTGPAIFVVIGLCGHSGSRQLPCLSTGLCETADRRHRGGADTLDRGRAGAARRRAPGAGRTVVSGDALFGLVGAAVIGLGLFGLITSPDALRKLLAFNVLGNGVFLFFGVVARRGAAAGLGGDPVPQALVITAIVVAFAATAMAIALLMQLFDKTGAATLADSGGDDGGDS